jgi:hypothetical protein
MINSFHIINSDFTNETKQPLQHTITLRTSKVAGGNDQLWTTIADWLS